MCEKALESGVGPDSVIVCQSVVVCSSGVRLSLSLCLFCHVIAWPTPYDPNICRHHALGHFPLRRGVVWLLLKIILFMYLFVLSVRTGTYSYSSEDSSVSL